MATTKLPLWALIQTLDVFSKLHEDDSESPPFGLINGNELSDAMRAFAKQSTVEDIHIEPLPADFPLVVLKLPHRGFAPDYMEAGSHRLVSRRMREAMALPPDVVQYRPVVLYSPSTDGAAQDYRELRLLVQQPALDLDKSDYVGTEYKSARTGKPFILMRTVTRFVLREDFSPRHDLFVLDESHRRVMATDALAERVMQAGCTGAVFIEPEGSYGLTGRWRQGRYRTADGVAHTWPEEPI